MRGNGASFNNRLIVSLALLAVLVLLLVFPGLGSSGARARASSPAVDRELVASLTHLLESSLSTRRQTSAPPTNPSGKVTDLSARSGPGGTAVFAWSFLNPGDYNQDGIVNILDITPLAAHFQEPATATNEWIDGNGDSAITILDVTPLAANFFNVVSGYVLEHSPDNEEATYAEVLRDTVANMTVDDTGRLQLELTLDSPVYGEYYRVRPYDEAVPDEPGIPSDPVMLGAAGLVLKLSETTPAESGDGKTEGTPYVLLTGTQYQLLVENMQGADLSAEATLTATPPFFVDIGGDVPRTLEVTDPHAGDFTVQAFVDDLSSNAVYFRVPME